MAERLKDFDFASLGRPIEYPWSEWTDGSIWKAVGGKDFHCTVSSFRNNLRSYGSRNKMSVKTSLDKENPKAVIFQFEKTS